LTYSGVLPCRPLLFVPRSLPARSAKKYIRRSPTQSPSPLALLSSLEEESKFTLCLESATRNLGVAIRCVPYYRPTLATPPFPDVRSTIMPSIMRPPSISNFPSHTSDSLFGFTVGSHQATVKLSPAVGILQHLFFPPCRNGKQGLRPRSLPFSVTPALFRRGTSAYPLVSSDECEIPIR